MIAYAHVIKMLAVEGESSRENLSYFRLCHPFALAETIALVKFLRALNTISEELCSATLTSGRSVSVRRLKSTERKKGKAVSTALNPSRLIAKKAVV